MTGDFVYWTFQDNLETGVIHNIKQRSSVLQRPHRHQNKPKPIAANISQIIIVIATEPEPVEHYIDRYLIIAKQQNINPILVLNKTDLLNPNKKKFFGELLEIYKTLGYKVLETNYNTEKYGNLIPQLKGHTSIFVGQSGVGKSTLLNKIFNKDLMQVNQVSQRTMKGKHTTTSAQLHHLNKDTCIIDSPGIRELGIWSLSHTDITKGFKEICIHQKYCKYRNCSHHSNEKDCAVIKAVKHGEIHPNRLINYYRLIQEVTSNQTY